MEVDSDNQCNHELLGRTSTGIEPELAGMSCNSSQLCPVFGARGPEPESAYYWSKLGTSQHSENVVIRTENQSCAWDREIRTSYFHLQPYCPSLGYALRNVQRSSDARFLVDFHYSVHTASQWLHIYVSEPASQPVCGP